MSAQTWILSRFALADRPDLRAEREHESNATRSCGAGVTWGLGAANLISVPPAVSSDASKACCRLQKCFGENVVQNVTWVLAPLNSGDYPAVMTSALRPLIDADLAARSLRSAASSHQAQHFGPHPQCSPVVG